MPERVVFFATLALTATVGCSSPPRVGTAPVEVRQPPSPSEAEHHWRYTIAVDEAVETMTLGLCIEGPPPRRLSANDGAIRHVREARVRGGPKLERDGQTFLVRDLGDSGCLDLRIDLDAAIASGGRDSVRRGDTAMVPPGKWLWHPSEVPDALDAQARFELPEGMHATVPWGELDGGWRRLEHSAFRWGAWVLFGHYTPMTFDAAGTTFEVAIADREFTASRAGVEAWIRVAGETSAELHGTFPRERVSVVVLPSSGWSSAPVLFGMARRGGGASAMLMLNQDAEDDELIGEWVAAHEFLHFTMPLVADPWMAEGFVTYYTQVLRARRGVLAYGDEPAPGEAFTDFQAREAIAKLATGFRRTRGTTTKLGYASDNMRRLGGYGRVYWGGAALAFDLDRQLRQASGGRRSLDDLMIAMVELIALDRRWQAEDLFAHFDRQVAGWYAAGELSVEISPTAIMRSHLDAKSAPRDITDLDGLAARLVDGEPELQDRPEAAVSLRNGLFGKRSDRP